MRSSQTGRPSIPIQSVSPWHPAHSFCIASHRAAAASLHSEFALHATHTKAPVLHTSAISVQKSSKSAVHSTHCKSSLQTGVSNSQIPQGPGMTGLSSRTQPADSVRTTRKKARSLMSLSFFKSGASSQCQLGGKRLWGLGRLWTRPSGDAASRRRPTRRFRRQSPWLRPPTIRRLPRY